MFNEILACFGSNIKAIEVLDVMFGEKPCARQCFSYDEMELVKMFCKEKDLYLELSPLRVKLTDRGVFSNKGVLSDSEGLFVGYISKERKKAMLGCLYELRQDHALLGEVLGYPRCCAVFFNEINKKGEFNPVHTPENGWTNISLREKDVVLLSHFPCKNDCEASIEIAKRRLALIEKYDAGLGRVIREKLLIQKVNKNLV